MGATARIAVGVRDECPGSERSSVEIVPSSATQAVVLFAAKIASGDIGTMAISTGCSGSASEKICIPSSRSASSSYGRDSVAGTISARTIANAVLHVKYGVLGLE